MVVNRPQIQILVDTQNSPQIQKGGLGGSLRPDVSKTIYQSIANVFFSFVFFSLGKHNLILKINYPHLACRPKVGGCRARPPYLLPSTQ